MRFQPRFVPLCLIPALVIFLSMNSVASAFYPWVLDDIEDPWLPYEDNLVLHYEFEDADPKADLGLDSSGNNYTATLAVPDRITVGPSVSSSLGQAIHLDSGGGADTGRLLINYPTHTVVPSTATPTTALTLATWVNIDVLCAGMSYDNENTVFGSQSQSSVTGGVEAWGIKLRIDGERRDLDPNIPGYDFEGMDINFGLYNAAGDCFLWAKIEKDDQGNWLPEMCEHDWMHIMVTYDKASNFAAIFLDGVMYDFSSAINTAITDRDINPVWDWATIGTFDPTKQGDRPYQGYLDDFRIYDRCLYVPEPGASTMILILGIAVTAFVVRQKKNATGPKSIA